MRKLMVRIICVLCAACMSMSNAWAEPLKIVTTLPTFADLAKTVGGDNVEVSAVASPRFNPHFIEPRPSDVLKVKKCDLFIHGGLDLEAWRGPLVDAAGRGDIRTNGEKQLDLSTRIHLLEVPDHSISRAEGDIHLYGNPHYWLSPENGQIIAEEIAEKLSAMDPTHSADYRSNLDAFRAQLAARTTQWKRMLQPFAGQKLVGYHNEWIYFTDYFGLKMEQFLEPKPGIPPTPQQIELLTQYIKKNNVHAIIQPTFYPKDAGEKLAKNAGAKLLLLAQGVGELPEAKDFISFMDFNVMGLAKALAQ